MQLPSDLVNVTRAVVGRFALYAPRDAGAMTIWRGFLANPWSPDTDLLVAVPRVGNEAIFRLLVANAGARVVVEDEPLLAVRPAHRGVTLAEVLEKSAEATSRGARPPLELIALLTRALDRPGLRVQRITSPHQIVISWDGDVYVDGLDPAAVPRPWADGIRAHVEACLVASVARGRVDVAGARTLVDEVAASALPNATGATGVIARAIFGRFAAAEGRGHELDDVVDLAGAKAVVSGLVRSLFPERYDSDRAAVEEMATLDSDALYAWTHRAYEPSYTPPAPTGDAAGRAAAATMRRGADAERALVATELAALFVEGRGAIATVPRSASAHAALASTSMWQRFTRWLNEAWHLVRHRIASARTPRVLTTHARPAPRRPLPLARRTGRRPRSSTHEAPVAMQDDARPLT